MKLIIDIPEEDYIRLRDEGMFGNVTTFKRAVREGIPLEQEPCNDVISRQAVLDLAKFDGRENLGSIIHAFDVEQLPPVTPAEKVGQWISNAEDDLKISEYTCSNCKGLSDEDSDFCPKCGSYNGGTQHDD